MASQAIALGRKAQASLEVLILLAALLGTLAVLLPKMQLAQQAAREGIIVAQEKMALEQMAGLMRESDALGEGTMLQAGLYFPVPTRLEASQGTVRFAFEGVTHHALNSSVSPSWRIPQQTVGPGKRVLRVENGPVRQVRFWSGGE